MAFYLKRRMWEQTGVTVEFGLFVHRLLMYREINHSYLLDVLKALKRCGKCLKDQPTSTHDVKEH